MALIDLFPLSIRNDPTQTAAIGVEIWRPKAVKFGLTVLLGGQWRMIQDLNDLFYFAQVVEHRGFAAAGRVLGMPRSKLSRRIFLLEERLGVLLIQRSTRQFSVTDIGQEYYRHCLAVMVEVEAAQETIEETRSEPRGPIRVSCPGGLLQSQVSDMLASFLEKHRLVQIYLESTNRRIDVVAEGFDIALSVRFGPIDESDLVMRALGERPQRMVASPAFLDEHKSPQVPADLSLLPTLDWGSSQNEHSWLLEGPEESTAVVRHISRLVTSDLSCLRRAALRGVGIAQLPIDMVSEDLRQGTLVTVLPSWKSQPGIVYAAFSSRRGMLPSVRALIDFLASEFKALDRDGVTECRD
jgi:DNA-binding transcriptional LysR family regulator